MPVVLKRAGPEVLVNTETNDSQGSSNIAALHGGGFIIVWGDNSGTGGDTSPSGVKAQIFDVDGQKVGGEFLVNTSITGAQSDPRVATLPSGQFVVAWVDFGGESGTLVDGSDSCIRAQIFEADGDKVGDEFLVNTTAPGYQTHIAISELSGGGFVITWDDLGPPDAFDLNVRGQVYDQFGQPVGGEILVNTTVAGSQTEPSVISLANGGFIVAWLGAAAGISGGATCFQVFDEDGHKIGSEQAFASGPNTQRITGMAALDSGFVIAYGSNSGDASGQSIEVQRFDENGVRVGGEILANTVTAGDQQAPHVDALPGGGFIVFWRGPGDPDGTADIRAQIFDADGNKEGGEFVINTVTAGQQDLVRAAMLDTGELAVTWTDGSGIGGDASGNGIKLQIFQPVQTGTPGDDNIAGGTRVDFIDGLGGADRLSGGGGDDVIDGGAGNDTFYVAQVGDIVREAVGDGFDRVYTECSYTLAAGQEIEVLSTRYNYATDAFNLTGNEFANTIIGNAGANILNGDGGIDDLRGLAGDDIYYVDQSADIVREAVGGGFDRVNTDSSYTLAAGQEIEVLSAHFNHSTNALNLTGNAFGNFLIGNDGANILNGGGGADQLRGLSGNDTYYVDQAGDAVEEIAGAGFDRVYTEVSYTLAAGQEIEVLSTRVNGATDAIDLTGNAFANTLIGNAGANVLDGGRGNDELRGLGGADTFLFDTALGPNNVDKIADFVHAVDSIHLDNAVFTALADGALDPNAFHTGSAAADADDRIIYNSATGALFYDADGNGAGAAIQFATLQPGLAITSNDFAVI